jgi:hypothetical protein
MSQRDDDVLSAYTCGIVVTGPVKSSRCGECNRSFVGPCPVCAEKAAVEAAQRKYELERPQREATALLVEAEYIANRPQRLLRMRMQAEEELRKLQKEIEQAKVKGCGKPFSKAGFCNGTSLLSTCDTCLEERWKLGEMPWLHCPNTYGSAKEKGTYHSPFIVCELCKENA